MSVVDYTLDGSTAVVTLDSPENRNAISRALLEGLDSAVARASADEAVRSIVLTHTGTVFCAGADLNESSHPAGGEGTRQNRGQAANSVIRSLLSCPKPIIGAIHGHVRAGGMGFVAACDLVVAGPKATFGLSEVRIGVVAAMIAPVVLARLGDRTAADWLLRARTVSPAEAQAAGFISHAVGADEGSVDDAVADILADLRKGAPRALAASKALVNRAILEHLDAREAEMIDLSGRFFASSDAEAGIKAFFDRTTPPWHLSQ